jgi:hypothetical protein
MWAGIACTLAGASRGANFRFVCRPRQRSFSITANHDAHIRLFVKRENGVDWAELLPVVSNITSVVALKEQLKEKLELKEPLDAFTLHVAKDRHGRDLGDALDSTGTVAEALCLLQLAADQANRVRIVAKVGDGLSPFVLSGGAYV